MHERTDGRSVGRSVAHMRSRARAHTHLGLAVGTAAPEPERDAAGDGVGILGEARAYQPTALGNDRHAAEDG